MIFFARSNSFFLTKITAFPAAPAAATALLLVLAMPGGKAWWPLLFVALVPLLFTIRRLSPLQSGCTGLLCGILYHINMLYWIANVLKQYGGLQAWLAVGAMLLLALYMASYTALFCLLLNLLAARPGEKNTSATTVLLLAPIIWVGLDVLRGYLFTGMPWMDIGYGLYRQPLLIQAADLGGHHLLTFCLVQINALVFWLLCDRDQCSRRHYLYATIISILLYCIGGYSCMRYRQVSSILSSGNQATVAVAQGNINQNGKWSPAMKEETVNRYLALSGGVVKNTDKIDLLVWPETALPFYPPREPLMNHIRDFSREKRIYLLTGSPYFTVIPKKKRPVEYFNSALLLDRFGKLTGRYNKQHLVPFGEYVPLRSYLWFVKPLVELLGDFTSGDSFDPLQTEKINAGVLICFESIFPKIARRETAAGANLLVSMTNDAWYGRSSAPHHSWAMTVMRAVENKRSLVRAANTGISGFVEPTGTIRTELPMFQSAALAETMVLLTERTVFTRGGHWFGACCSALTLILPLLYWSTRKRRLLRQKAITK